MHDPVVAVPRRSLREAVVGRAGHRLPLLIGLGVLAASLIATAFLLTPPLRYPDTLRYWAPPGDPPRNVSWLGGRRSGIVTTLVYRLLGYSPRVIVVFQVLVAFVAGALLISALAWRARSRVEAWLLPIGAAVVLASWQVTSWHTILLMESLSLSGVVAMLAVTIAAMKSTRADDPRRLAVIAAAAGGAAACAVFAHASLMFWAVPCLLGVTGYLARIGLRRLVVAGLALVVLVLVGWGVGASVRTERFYERGWAANRDWIRGQDPSYRSASVDEGRPPCPRVDRLVATGDLDPLRRALAEEHAGRDPGFCRRYWAWIDGGGLGVLEASVRHPGLMAELFLDDLGEVLGSPDYSVTSGFHPPRLLPEAWFGGRGRPDLRGFGLFAGLAVLTVVGVVAARLPGARASWPRLVFGLLLLGATVLGAYLAWASDGIELGRHAVVWTTLLRLQLLVVPAGFVITRVRTRPS